MHNLTSFGAILSSPLMLQAESLRQPFPPPAQLAEVEDTPRPFVIEGYKPSHQFPESLHVKVVSRSNRTRRDEYLKKYGPVALVILEKASVVFGEDIFGFHRQRLLSVLQGIRGHGGHGYPRSTCYVLEDYGSRGFSLV